MIRHIIRKELLVNLLSMRFLIGLIVSVSLMSLVGYILVEEYAARQQTYLSDVQAHRQALAQTKVYSLVKATVDIPPSPLSVFSRGVNDLPTSFVVSPFHIPSFLDEGGGSVTISLGGTGNRPTNPLLRMFTPIDLCFVISSILSLFAVLLVFDSFSGERESGTLKLLFSSSTGRVHLLIGKFLGALLTLAIPLTIGFLVIMILWAIHPGLALATSVWLSAGAIFVVSLLFLSSFLSLALLVSLYARESSSCLMYLLLGWVVVTIVIPQGGEYIAEFMSPEYLREKLLTDADRSAAEFRKEYLGIDYHQKGGWNNAYVDQYGGESLLGITREEAYNRMEFTRKILPLKIRYAEERYRGVESFADALMKWSRMRDNMVRPSLCVLYTNVVQAIAGTNIETFEDIVGKGRLYRDAMMAFLEPKMQTPEWFTRIFEYPDIEPTEKNMRYWQELIGKEGERAVEKLMSWDRVTPLDLSGLPSPQIGVQSTLERAGHSLTDGLLLIGSTALFLVLGTLRVRRYPVN